MPPGCDPGSIVLTFKVAHEHAGQRLDRFIRHRIARLSRTKAQRIVSACAYHHDGRRRKPSDRVKAGEVVLLVRPAFEEPPTPIDFEVLYEDEALMAIDKPSGLPVHPSATYHKNTLTYRLRERFGSDAPHIAHRLDRETSGLILCAKHIDAERTLKTSFENRRVQKTYLAIVRGQPKDQGLIELPLARVTEGLHVLMHVPEQGGYPSVTDYRVLSRAPSVALVELSPKSGRQHQLRVHLGAIGHPIIGDKLYGPEGHAPFMTYIETGMTDALRDRLGHERQALHAHALTFDHPESHQPMTLQAPLSQDLASLWTALGGQNGWNTPDVALQSAL